eukprot:Filipodium_phascolosomae@DN1_c0_g1_i1.p1
MRGLVVAAVIVVITQVLTVAHGFRISKRVPRTKAEYKSVNSLIEMAINKKVKYANDFFYHWLVIRPLPDRRKERKVKTTFQQLFPKARNEWEDLQALSDLGILVDNLTHGEEVYRLSDLGPQVDNLTSAEDVKAGLVKKPSCLTMGELTTDSMSEEREKEYQTFFVKLEFDGAKGLKLSEIFKNTEKAFQMISEQPMKCLPILAVMERRELKEVEKLLIELDDPSGDVEDPTGLEVAAKAHQLLLKQSDPSSGRARKSGNTDMYREMETMYQSLGMAENTKDQYKTLRRHRHMLRDFHEAVAIFGQVLSNRHLDLEHECLIAESEALKRAWNTLEEQSSQKNRRHP